MLSKHKKLIKYPDIFIRVIGQWTHIFAKEKKEVTLKIKGTFKR